MNEQNFFIQLQIFGIIISLFGITIVAFALRSKYLRGSIQGIHMFALTDSVPLSKRSEHILQNIGLLMILDGMILIAVEAVQQYQQLVWSNRSRLVVLKSKLD